MGFLTDLLKEIPLSAIQAEKLAAAESKHQEEKQRMQSELDAAQKKIRELESTVSILQQSLRSYEQQPTEEFPIPGADAGL
jgi:uncharacterized protein YlxW (UPF0749 family)